VPGPLTILVGQVSAASESAFGNITQFNLNGGVIRMLNPGSTAILSKPIFVNKANGQISTGNASVSQTTDLTVNSTIADMPWSNGSVALPGQASGSVQFGGFGTITRGATAGSNSMVKSFGPAPASVIASID